MDPGQTSGEGTQSTSGGPAHDGRGDGTDGGGRGAGIVPKGAGYPVEESTDDSLCPLPGDPLSGSQSPGDVTDTAVEGRKCPVRGPRAP